MTEKHNIPIFRAQRLDSTELIIGHYLYHPKVDEHKIVTYTNDALGVRQQTFQIKPETLAIHFPNMLDINEKPIFASLNKNGIGGDKITDDSEQYVCLFNTTTNSAVMPYTTEQETIGVYDNYWETFKIVGVHL